MPTSLVIPEIDFYITSSSVLRHSKIKDRVGEVAFTTNGEFDTAIEVRFDNIS